MRIAASASVAVLCLASLAGLGAGAPARAADRSRTPDRTVAASSPYDRLKAAGEAAHSGDCAAMLSLVTPELLEGPDFARQLPEFRGAILGTLGACEAQAGQMEAGRVHARAATDVDPQEPYLWNTRLALDLNAKAVADAVATVEAMAAANPQALNAIPIRWLSELNRKVSPPSQAPLRRRLLIVLGADAFQPDDPFDNRDGFRLAYARQLQADGDTARARALALGLTDPDMLISASLDPAFRDLWPDGPDVRAAVEHDLAEARLRLKAHPDRLRGVLRVSGDLRRLGRAEEAMSVLEAVQGGAGAIGAYTDRDEQLNWWWDDRARTLDMLGRYDEAVDSFRGGVRAGEQRGPINVSQVINLAEMQLRWGKYDAALATLAAGDHGLRSPFGEMVVRMVRGCAYAGAGRRAEALEDLAYVRAHDAEHPEALFDLLLCLGDLDGAAAALDARLNDPRRVAEALTQLSDWDQPPATVHPAAHQAALRALKARPDIQARLARAGGVRRFHIQSPDY